MSATMIEVLCKMALEAKTEKALEDTVKAAFNNGFEQGRNDRQREVREAFSQLGLTEAALFDLSS